jgi:hypothetical protein
MAESRHDGHMNGLIGKDNCTRERVDGALSLIHMDVYPLLLQKQGADHPGDASAHDADLALAYKGWEVVRIGGHAIGLCDRNWIDFVNHGGDGVSLDLSLEGTGAR